MKSNLTNERKIVSVVARFMTVVALVVMVIFYGLGGWHFSDVLRADALDIDPWMPEFDVTVVAASDDTVALDAIDDPMVRNDGWYGVRWESGYGIAGPIVESVGTSVVREFVLLDGEAISAGDDVDFDPWVWADPEQGLGLGFETVQYESPLGSMDAWQIPADSDDWIVAIHGRGADKREALRVASVAHRGGFNSLLIDYRNDDGAPPDPSGIYQYGATEWEDLEAAVEYLIDRGAERIVLVGLSTGAAISMSFLYQSELADAIDAVILDSPNLDMEQTVRFGARQTDLPFLGIAVPDSLTTASMWIAERRFDIDFNQWNYLEAVRELSVPILVIHGDADLTVPEAVSVNLATARPDLVTYEPFAGAGHVQSWNVDRIRYAEIVLEFLGRDA